MEHKETGHVRARFILAVRTMDSSSAKPGLFLGVLPSMTGDYTTFVDVTLRWMGARAAMLKKSFESDWQPNAKPSKSQGHAALTVEEPCMAAASQVKVSCRAQSCVHKIVGSSALPALRGRPMYMPDRLASGGG